MPINEIGAPFYAKMFYHVLVGHQHQTRYYFDEVPSFGSADTRFSGYVDTAHPLGWTLMEIITELDLRLAVSTTQYPAINVERVERWRSALGVNVFEGLDPDDYSAVGVGVATPIASASFSWVYETNVRAQYRFTTLDAGDARPQRTELPQPPVVDDGGIDWFILKSVVHFTNRDGVRLSRAVSNNTGYNRHASKRYGKNIIP